MEAVKKLVGVHKVPKVERDTALDKANVNPLKKDLKDLIESAKLD